MYGDGRTRRDYTYVDDVIAGVRAALTYQRSHYEVVNLGNSTTVTLLDMIRELERGLGVSANDRVAARATGRCTPNLGERGQGTGAPGLRPRVLCL